MSGRVWTFIFLMSLRVVQKSQKTFGCLVSRKRKGNPCARYRAGFLLVGPFSFYNTSSKPASQPKIKRRRGIHATQRLSRRSAEVRSCIWELSKFHVHGISVLLDILPTILPTICQSFCRTCFRPCLQTMLLITLPTWFCKSFCPFVVRSLSGVHLWILITKYIRWCCVFIILYVNIFIHLYTYLLMYIFI